MKSTMLKKLQDKEGELESRIVSKPEEDEVKETGESLETEEPKATDTEELKDQQTFDDDTSSKDPKEPLEDPAKKLAELDKRWRGYKASTDKTIFELREEKRKLLSDHAEALERIEYLEDQVTQAESVDYPFTEEDENNLGPEAMKVLKRMYKSSLEKAREPIAKQQKVERKSRIDEVKRLAKEPDESPMDRFKRELEVLEPSWQEYLANPKFKEFLRESNSRGISYEQRWRAAEKAQSPQLILDIFDAFDSKKTKGPLDSKLAMDESSTPTEPKKAPKAKVWTKAKVEEFYRDKRRGLYNKSQEKLAEAKAIEAEIDAFVASQFGG